MGEVYRARDLHLGREVAIKALPQAFARDPSRAARFEREARLLATLNHPSIAAIYGAEEFDGLPCIIMELVPGETLSEVLARGPLPLEEALDYASQIAEALEAAHERGIVHRDLKPSNIKITPDGKVKVLDLGLAKAVEPVSTEDLSLSPTVSLEETRPGVVLGTVEFMSPEQARGKPVDKRTDIWAFGCILYEMLSGRRAFTGESAADVFTAILSAEPDWAELAPSTPPRLRDLLSRCLQKDPRQRLRDMGDARLEIDRLRRRTGAITDISSLPAAASDESERRTALIAAAILIILVAGFLAWQRFRPPPLASRPAASAPGSRQLAVLPFHNLTGDESTGLMGIGLVETVSVRLSGLPGLQVLTSSAVVSAVDRRKEDMSAARDVGASLAVVGTFQRQGERVRITYRVVDVRSGTQIAASSLDGSASDLFSLQDALADIVAKDLHFSGIRRRRTVSPGLDGDQQARYLQAVGLLQRYDRRESVEQALAILGSLAIERPNAAPVQAALGRANLHLFAFTKDRALADRAIASADVARSLDPALPEVDVTVGETLLATGRAAEAAQAFRRALAVNAEDYEALLGLGRALEKTGDDAGAEASLKRAIRLQPSSFAAYNHLGAFYFHLGRYRDAGQMFGEAARMAPDSYRALSNLGGASTMACDFIAANEAYRKALAIQPNNAAAASNLGLNLLWTGHYAEAIRTLEKAAKLAPDNFVVWGNLGDAYQGEKRSEKAGSAYVRALALARDSLRLNPKDVQAYKAMAAALAKTGRAREAQEPMRQALSLDPKDPDVLANAATVAVLAGQSAEAIAWLRKAVDAGYCREIASRQPEFSPLRNDPAFRSIVAAPSKTAGL